MDPLQKKKLNGLLLGSSCLVASAFIGALPALANPTGPHVVSGQDTVSKSGNTTTVDQTSQKGFIDWNSFSIGKGQTVQFVQPGKGSVTVNRVTGGDPSKILGELLANGGVWIINGNGILFGKGSIVNVGSLIATTSDLGDDDFKNGKYRFKKGSNPNASVINQGTITATNGGSVVLSAAHVANEGVIQANLGKVVLGGAAAFTVDLNGDNLIRYQITKSVSQTPTNSKGDARDALVSNSGTIEANGGSVLMTSRAASNVQDNVINNSGIVEATSVHAHDGEVDLDAEGGTVKDSGTVDVSGTQAGQTGGDVTITGRKIVVADGAHIDAQGTDGGGTVLIGGGMHGAGKLEQAHKVVIGKAAIDVDAISKGNGGKVGIRSKGETTVNAVIDAEGGRKGGNGGYVETSGHELGMDASALVDTSAAKGIGGTWLLDPTDVVIENCGANCGAGDVDATAIGNSLTAGTNVTVEAVGTGAGTGNITVESNVTADGAGALSLLATFDIDVEASIQNAGGGNINLVAGWDGATGITGGSTTGKSNAAVNITAITSTPGAYGKNGGSVTIGYADSGTAISVGSAGGTTTVAAQNLYVGVSGCVTANAQLGYMGNGGGDINVVLSGDLTIQSDDGGTSRIGNTGTSGAVTGNITIASDNLTLQAYSSNDGKAVIGNAGTGAVSGNIAITTSGDVTMDAGNEFGKYNNTASIGNETTSAAGASGNIKLSVGGGLTMYANYGGTARIGSDSSTTNINVTVASNITMLEGGCEECGGPIHQGSEGSNYNTVQIGNYGGATSTVGGNISVTSTRGNITLTANSSGYVEIGNRGGLHVSGDVSVVAANGSITLNSYYGYSQIGNEGGGTGGTVTGNITVFAETGLSLYASYSSSHSQIGNYSYAGSGTTVSGDIFISAFGGTKINGGGGTTAWIGNIGDTETGDLTLVTGSLTVEQSGDPDSTTFGNMVASDLTGTVTTATAGTGGSGGGNVTVAIEGSGTTDWYTLFGSGLDFSNGNTLSLITTGAQEVDTSLQANENGNINLIAGWDGTTGYGAKSITVSQILSTPGAYGATGGDISVGGSNDVVVGTVSGNTTVAGANIGVSSTYGAFQATIGALGPSSGNITVKATGNVTVSTPNGGMAQIGNGGLSTAGDAGGNITIDAGGEVLLDAVDGDVQIGNGGINSNGNFSGNIDVIAGGAILVQGESGHAQIGNGGSGTNNSLDAGSDSGNITVQGASVTVSAGSGTGSYAQIGHGGAESDGASGASTSGNIDVVATDGNVTLLGGSSGNTDAEQNTYAQIGMGGPLSGSDTTNKDTGNITVNASGNISVQGGSDSDQQNGFAIIGDTGTAQKIGNITVTAGGNITIIGGSATGETDFGGLSNSFAMIGDDNQGDVTANVSVTAGGNLMLTGGVGDGNMAQIGSNGDSGNVTGNVKVSIGGATTITSTNAGADAWIGNGYQESGTLSGNTTFITNDLNTSADALGDFGQSFAKDLVGGNVTLEFTDTTGTAQIDGIPEYDSANTLKILSEGNIIVDGSIQNSGSGAIDLVAGWNGVSTSLSTILAGAGTAYGENSGFVEIEGDAQNTAVGSASGTTTVAASSVEVSATDLGFAQLGYHGAGGGAIVVDATNLVSVESDGNVDAQHDAILGNGDFNASGATGNATGNITINAGTGGVTVNATVANSVAAIGNVTDDGASGERGNISITTTGTVLVNTPDADSVAYIGDFSLMATTGGASGNISINAGTLNIENAGDDSESNIGNGGFIGAGATTVFTNSGAVTGDIKIVTGNVTMTASGNGSYGGQSRISDRGAGTVSGNISVTGTGNMTLQTDEGDVASIGNSEDGTDSTAGNITVIVGGNLSLLAQDTGESRIAAGQTADTNVNVSVTGDILMQVTGNPTTYGGQAIIGNFANGKTAASGNITVTSVDGNISLSTSETYGVVLIGNAIGTTVGGTVKVKAANGTIAINADGDGSLAQIGELGGDSASGGDVFVTAHDLEIEASGSQAVAQIGNGGEEMQGDASGNITIRVGGNLTIAGGDGIAMIGNGDPLGTGTGTASGNIAITVGNLTSIDSDAAAQSWIGNLADTGSESGSVTLKTFDFQDGDDDGGDFSAFTGADLVGGNVTLEFTDTSAFTQFNGVAEYDSANTLKILSAGSLLVAGNIQNAGNGAIYVIGGWDGTTTKSNQLTNAGVYGNNDGSVDVGLSASDVSVGSASGTTTVAADNVAVVGTDGLAQIGWNGSGGGDVSVFASGYVTVEAGDDFTAMIGNGGAGATGSITGNIAVTTAGGAVDLTASANGAIAEIGDLSDAASSEKSNITIDTSGGAIDLESGGTSSYAQIGDWEYGNGNLSGNITINAGAVGVYADGANSSSQIGNGNFLDISNNGTIGGNIDIHATTLSVEETAPEGGFEEARIGNLGEGPVTGDLDVTTTGNIVILADGDGAADIGNYSNPRDSNFNLIQAEGSGTVDVVSGGSITLTSKGTGAFTSIEFGGATSGTVDVTAQGDVTEDASGGGASLIGAGLFFNGGVNVDVTSKTGNIVVQTTGAYSTATIGNVEYLANGTIAGNITLHATDGDIELLADGSQANAIQIGNNAGAGGTASGNLVLTAGNELDIENGADSLIGNTGVSETGNVTISANDIAGDISPSIGNDLDDGNFTVTLSGDNTLTLATDIDVDSAHTLSLSNDGNIAFTGSIQNSGSGNITLDSQHTITIGGAKATGNVAVGTANGTLTVDATNVEVVATNGSAQLGFNGAGLGNIIIDAANLVGVGSNLSGAIGQIGNGGANVTGTVGGNITIDAGGAVDVLALGDKAQARIGNLSSTTTKNGNISINANGALTVQAEEGGLSAIGSDSTGGDITIKSADVTVEAGSSTGNSSGAENYASIGNEGGNIDITTGNVSVLAYGDSGAFVGSDGSSQGTLKGNITVTASGDIDLIAVSDSDDSDFATATIGFDAGEMTPVVGNVDVKAAGNIVLDASGPASGGIPFVSIGDQGDGLTGNTDVAAGGSIQITSAGYAAYAVIGGASEYYDAANGTFGSAAINGDLNVTANGNITVDSSSEDTNAGFGWAGILNGDVSITSKHGAIDLVASGSQSIANIGYIEGEDGNILVTSADGVSLSATGDSAAILIGATAPYGGSQDIATDISITTGGNVSLLASGANASVQIGNGGAQRGGTASGNITIDAGGAFEADAEGADTYVQVGNGGLDYNGDSSGDISIAAASVSLTNDSDSSVLMIGNGGDKAVGDASGNVSVAATGNMTIGIEASGAAVQIGNGGYASDGNATGNVTLTAAGDLEMEMLADGGTSYIQIGDGGSSAQGKANGNVDVTGANITLTTDNPGYIQIGNGGSEFDGNTSGTITVDASGNILADADIDDSYIQIGNGGNNSTGNDGGNIVLTAGSDLDLETTNSTGRAVTQGSYVQVGNGGDHSNEDSAKGFSETGNITVSAKTVELTASADISGVQVGNGGTCAGAAANTDCDDQTANTTEGSIDIGGDISVTATKSLSMTSGGTDDTVAIGNGGQESATDVNASGSIDYSGNITVVVGTQHAAGTLIMSAGDNDLTLIGNGGFEAGTGATASNGISDSGDIAVTVLGGNDDGGSATLTANATNNTSAVRIGNMGKYVDDISVVGNVDFDVDGSIALATSGQAEAVIGDTISGNSLVGTVEISADSLTSSGDAFITGDSADITMTGGGSIGSASNAFDVVVNDLAISSSGGSAYISTARALSIGVGTDGIDLGSGDLVLTANGSVSQTEAIVADALAVSAKGTIQLTNSANAFSTADLTTSGTHNASLYDASDLTISDADVGGTLSLSSAGDISQTGAITATALNATAHHGSVTLTNTGNSFADASVKASADASLFDATGLTILGAKVGGTFTLSGGGDIGQSGAITAGTLDVTASQGAIALTDSGNAIGNASLNSSDDATLYDSISLALQSASVGGNLTLLTKGNLDFESSVQLSNGNILAVAGWDGTTTSASALTKAGAYGNNGGSIVVGGTRANGDVAVGSATGSTTFAGANVSLEADNGYAQIGFHGSASGALDVFATQAVMLSGGTGSGDYAQIGNGGMDTSGNESGNITVKAGGAVDLDGGTGADAYAQIGHGGADADKDSHGYTNTGNITVQGQTVELVAGAGDQSYTQIGQGGFDLGDGLTGKGENQGDVDVTAADGVTLAGNGADAYAQIGNGGDHVNANAASSASGSNTGSVTVDAGSGTVTITAGVDDSSYVQIGNGGFDVNAGDNPANFSDSGTIMVSDLTLLGSNTGMDGYAQVGNGDASDNGVGDATGNITVSAGTILLTDGKAKDSPALIGNQTGAGSISGTITGYTPPATGSTNPPPPVVGAIETTIQSQTGEPVDLIVTPPEDLPPPSGDSGATPQSIGPLAQLTGDDGQSSEGADTATDELGQSLDGGSHAQTVSIIPGVLTEVVYTETPHGIPPANQDYSSWGNEALWRW